MHIPINTYFITFLQNYYFMYLKINSYTEYIKGCFWMGAREFFAKRHLHTRCPA